MKTIEAFAGIGGQALGWHHAGSECLAFIEREPFAQRVLRRHWPDVPVFDDILTFDAAPYRGKVDALVGGPPCQGASSAGSRKGTEDERWLWGAFVDLAVKLDAPIVVAENVPGLFTVQEGDGLHAILCAFGDAGYRVEWDVLAAGTLGAPHRRERVFIVARKDGRWTWPAVNAQRSMFPGRPGKWARAGRWYGHTLTTCERQWPTPRPLPWEGAAGGKGHSLETDRRRRSLPTPTTRDHKDGTAESCANVPVNALLGREVHERTTATAKGRLSPALPEWMLGFPEGWSCPEGPPLLDAPSRAYLPDLTAELALTTEREHRRPRLKGLGNAVQVDVAALVARSVMESR